MSVCDEKRKEYNALEKDYIWNPSVCICGNGE